MESNNKKKNNIRQYSQLIDKKIPSRAQYFSPVSRQKPEMNITTYQ